MNENINLCELLKGHEDETFYSPVFGNVKIFIEEDKIKMEGRYNYMYLSRNGHNCSHEDLVEDCNFLECLIFPSKDQRDWNKWAEEQKPKVPKIWSDISDNSISNTEKNSVYKSVLALMKLHQLIETGYGGIPTREERDNNVTFHIFRDWDNNFYVDHGSLYSPVVFHSKEQAEEFLSYPENVQLLEDFLMI